MKNLTKGVKGAQDLLPNKSYKWRFLTQLLWREAELYGFKEIRTPVFEHTELFKRSVGDCTDVVQKEMYTFNDKGERSITLRPEGTAGVVRAMIEHGLYNQGLPLKLGYLTSCYRYENPQTGRLREFFQFGFEIFGTGAPVADAELICLANSILKKIGIKDVCIQINSIGCPDCRRAHCSKLLKYFECYKEQLCETCLERLGQNTMRIIDCKNYNCARIAAAAPNVLDDICHECKEHFEAVKKLLDFAKIEYKINSKIVRGLDYYTKTVFEILVHSTKNSELVIGGGGRYDGLVKEISDRDMPALGFAFGIERLLMVMQEQNLEPEDREFCDIYIANVGQEAFFMALALANQLREANFRVEIDLMGRGLKAQMKQANKMGAKFTAVLGDDELKTGIISLKNMLTGEQTSVQICSDFPENFAEIIKL